jgi:hypothetical protein
MHNPLSIERNVLAILARFGGNHTAAMDYCFNLAAGHVNLRKEYELYGYTILEMKGSRI